MRPSSACLVAAALLLARPAAAADPAAVSVETLLKSAASWDGVAYRTYPEGRPELTVLKITVPPRTALAWHTHPIPNAAYVLAGELRVEKQDGTLARRVAAGEVLAEMVNAGHRGVTGEAPAVLIVFYAGAAGVPLSSPVAK